MSKPVSKRKNLWLKIFDGDRTKKPNVILKKSHSLFKSPHLSSYSHLSKKTVSKVKRFSDLAARNDFRPLTVVLLSTSKKEAILT